MTSWMVWLAFIAISVMLGFIGYWFSLKTLRWSAAFTAVVLLVAVTLYGSAHPARASADVVDAFLRGVDAVVIALLQPLWRSNLTPPLGGADRWIIAAALILGYRGLEAWTLRWQAPQLDLSAIGHAQRATVPLSPSGETSGGGADATASGLTDAQEHDKLAAELRFRLPAMEIRSPAILPGGRRTNALASIVQSSGVSGAGVMSAVVQLAGLLWPTAGRVRARIWMEHAPQAPGPRITVLLDDARTGRTVATKTIAASSPEQAGSLVAGYIAREIFAMDRSVAEWCYGTADGRDLGAMQLVRMERVYAACPEDVPASRRERLRILRNWAGGIRCAGVVRYELAQLCALNGEHLEALRLHALNRELYPRLYRGRYRLAMTLEMIASPEHRLAAGPRDQRKLQEILDSLSRYKLKEGNPLPLAVPQKAADSAKEAAGEADGRRVRNRLVSATLRTQLLGLAAEELSEVRKQLTLWRVMRDAIFRRDERPVWLPHWQQRHRETFHDGVCVAQLFIHARKRLAGPPGTAPPPAEKRELRHLRKSVRIASFIAGDKKYLATLLSRPLALWPPPPRPQSHQAGKHREWMRSRNLRDRVRWLPWQRRTASWQAAYNTACLYAVLADAAVPRPTGRGKAEPALANPDPAQPGGAESNAEVLEQWVITSLRRAIDNPRTELDRPSSWIRADPDFTCLRQHPKIFQAFESFVNEQTAQDYPYAHECPLHHPGSSGTPAPSEARAAPELSPPALASVPDGAAAQ